MKRYLAAWLTTWSMARRRKSMNSISTTGRWPAIAAPTPRPTNPASLRGVSMTRPAELRQSPSVTLYEPPRSPMPSPTQKTAGSRSISSSRAARRASLYFILAIVPQGFGA
jgi:hypothetical protein